MIDFSAKELEITNIFRNQYGSKIATMIETGTDENQNTLYVSVYTASDVSFVGFNMGMITLIASTLDVVVDDIFITGCSNDGFEFEVIMGE